MVESVAISDPDEKKGKDKLVPLSALEDERHKRQSAEQQVAELRGHARGLSDAAAAAPSPDIPKELSTAELQQAVTDGRMTEAEADAIRERQSERRIETRVAEKAEVREEARAISGRASDEIGRYQKAIPDLADQASAPFQKARTEFDYLVTLGHDPRDARTELLAARSAFGDISKLEQIGQEQARETHQETGGGRDPGSEGGSREDGWPKDMPAKNRAYYEKEINKGVIADRKAALAEWNYKPKHSPGYAA